MLITCPKCKTTYKVSDELVQGPVPSFRCSRCRHTFEINFEHAQPHGEEPPAENSAADQELSFIFGAEEAATKSQSAIPDTESDETPSRAEEPQAESLLPEPQFSRPEETAPPTWQSPKPSAPAASEHEAADNILALDPYRDRKASTVPYLTLFALLILLYALITVFNYSHPSATERVFGTIPLLGSSVLKNTHLKDSVALQSIQAGYQSIQGNREVFVITGIASNQNPVKIRRVRVSGQVYDRDGKQIEQQTVWVGNAISPKIVRGMSAQDISDLQRLEPLKTFDIPPGDTVPFTIVFLKGAKAIKEFTCGVVAAEGEAA